MNLKTIEWCAAECEKQKSGEMSVSHMCVAYHHAKYIWFIKLPLDVEFIQTLGRLVEPVKNANGFRTQAVYFNDITEQALSPDLIHQAINSLVRHGQNLTAEEGYYEFEKIHPFIDGNGRVGAILYNIFRGTLDNPVHPPDMFKREN